MSANQLAAKAMQLKLKGKHEEAAKLLVSSLLSDLPLTLLVLNVNTSFANALRG